MSCTLSHECQVMLCSLLTASSDATRVWLRAEMDRTVDPMLHSIFNRLTTKLTNALGQTQSAGDGDCAQVGNQNPCFPDQSDNVQLHQPPNLIPPPSTSSHINSQFVNMNYSYQQKNGPNHLDNSSISTIESQSIPIKEEIETTTNEPMPTHQVQSCSYAPVSNEQSNHKLTDQHSNNKEEWDNSRINLPNTEIRPQQLAHIKHNQFDDEEFDCDECVDGGIEVKEDDDDDDQVDEQSSRPVKRPKMDTTQPNNAQPEVAKQSVRQPNDEVQSNEDRPHEDGDRLESEQSEAIETQSTLVIQQEERDANNAIGDEIATECTTNPIQPNLAQPNCHFQCSHCLKSFDRNSKLQQHLRVHTGEHPFPCDQCDKRFTQKVHLETHLRAHSGERPFKCRHCEKSFAELKTRTNHEQAIHLHVKPYRCKQCGHTATQRSHVITHIRVVHFGLPQSIKQQRALNIIDKRDPRELVEKV